MKAIKLLSLAGAVALVAALSVSPAKAGFGVRQYYTGWSYCSKGYWYCTYNYKPYVGYPSYCYNYCVWYPKTPKFCYFYNPYKGTYWGRYDAQTKGYSLLAEKDRAGQLKDIPEKAFPAEGPLPNVPDAKDKLTLAEPPDLPLGENTVVKKTTKGEDTATADTAGDALTTTPADAAATAAPAGDALAADSKADPKADSKADPKAPPADGAAAATPPAGGAAPGGPATPGDAPVTPDSGTGVVPPAEPVTPAPAAGGAAPATGGAVGGPAPVDGGVVAPVGGVVGPNGGFYPSNCKHKFGGCPSHGYGQGYNWGWHK